jgi:DNA-binding NarL/FixJ family response regulator
MSIVLVGQYDGAIVSGNGPENQWSLLHCDNAEPARLRAMVRQHSPMWLLAGSGLSDDMIQQLFHAGRGVSPGIRLAVLGEPGDVYRSNLWMRRGCDVYLADVTHPHRLFDVLSAAARHNFVAVDRSLWSETRIQQLELTASLTVRELEVLRLLGRGLRNAAIAHELRIAVSTVEFHLRHVFAKLGVGGRVDAVRRAHNLGVL